MRLPPDRRAGQLKKEEWAGQLKKEEWAPIPAGPVVTGEPVFGVSIKHHGESHTVAVQKAIGILTSVPSYV